MLLGCGVAFDDRIDINMNMNKKGSRTPLRGSCRSSSMDPNSFIDVCSKWVFSSLPK